MATDPNPVQDETIQPDNEERPSWLPDNFKSPEALAESYKELQREFHQRNQRQSELEQQVANYEEWFSNQQQQQPQQPQQPSALDLRSQIEQMDPTEVMAALAMQQQQISQKLDQLTPQMEKQFEPLQKSQTELAAEYATASLRTQYQDFGDLEDQIVEKIQDDPVLGPALANAQSPDQFRSVIDSAYKAVKYEALLNQNKDLEEQQADLMRQNKLASQTLSGTVGRPDQTDDDKAWWEEIKKHANDGEFRVGRR